MESVASPGGTHCSISSNSADANNARAIRLFFLLQFITIAFWYIFLAIANSAYNTQVPAVQVSCINSCVCALLRFRNSHFTQFAAVCIPKPQHVQLDKPANACNNYGENLSSSHHTERIHRVGTKERTIWDCLNISPLCLARVVVQTVVWVLAVPTSDWTKNMST